MKRLLVTAATPLTLAAASGAGASMLQTCEPGELCRLK